MVCAYGLRKRFLTQIGHGISYVALFLASGAGYAITEEHNYFSNGSMRQHPAWRVY